MLSIVGQMVCALEYLHEQGFTHADVKGENICLCMLLGVRWVPFAARRTRSPRRGRAVSQP